MKLYRNIDLMQLNVSAGALEVYFPKNVAWRDAVIEKILIVAPDGVTVYSPIDGQTPIMELSELKNCYADFYDDAEKNIARSLHTFNILQTNNYPFEIGSKLSLSLSRFVFTQAPVQDCCIMAYVFYNSVSFEAFEESKQNITINFTLPANGKLFFKDFIDEYMHVKKENVRGIIVWDGASFYMTLRDETEKLSFNYIHSDFLHPTTNVGVDTQTQLAYFDYIDIDMDNSFVVNAVNSDQNIKITFLY